jgi:DNA-binding IclR family transcriptional regulator
MGSSVSGVGVIDKAAMVLAALEEAPRSLPELVAATGFSRATAHRLAVALEVHGLVRRDDDGRFTLGVRLIALGRTAAEAIPLADAAVPALGALRDETGESVQLYLRDGDRRVCIAALESPHGLRTIVPMGASLPLDVGSAGRILSGRAGAGSGPAARGWAESVGEREAGVASVSAGVLDADGAPVAAVSVSGPIERTTRHPGDRYGDAVLAAARRIEVAAGLHPA